MLLKPEERKELVDYLVTNCDCWKHEGSDKVLNEMKDEQLVSFAENFDMLAEAGATLNAIQKTFELPDTLAINAVPEALRNVFVENNPAFDRTDGSGEEVQSGGGDEEEPDDSEEEDMMEGEDMGEEMKKHTSNQKGETPKPKIVTPVQRKQKPMTTNQWLAQAPPEVQVVVRNAMRVDAEVKEELVEAITANANNPFSEEQLFSMTTEQLRPLAQLAATASSRREEHVRPTVNNFFGAAAPVSGRSRQQAPKEEDMLIPPTINWTDNAKEFREELAAK